MAVSNSIFFGVRAAPTGTEQGWTLRVRDPRTMNDTIAEFQDWVSFTISPQLNDDGAGSVTLDADSRFWASTLPNGEPATFILDWECLWEAYEDGNLRFQWLGDSIEESQIAEDLSRTITISGPGVAHTLDWGLILRPGFPAAIPAGLDPDTAWSGSQNVPAFYWGFSQKWPLMRMWWTLFWVAAGRGCFPWWTLLFTETKDAAGTDWEYIPIVLTESGDAYQPSIGTTIREFLTEATGQDTSKNLAAWNEWHVWPGYKLDVRPTIGTHREDHVVFYEPQTVTKQRTRSRADIRNVIVVKDRNGVEAIATDSDSLRQWHRREKLEDGHKNVTDADRRTTVAANLLKQQKDEKSQWEIEVPADLDGRRAFYDYDIGDWIGIATHNIDGTNRVDAYRVLVISIEVDATGNPRCQLTLQSVFEAAQISLQRELTRVVNNLKEVADDPLAGTPASTGVPSVLTQQPDGTYNWKAESGGKVWMQLADPGTSASIGDFWYAFDPPAVDPTTPTTPTPTAVTGSDGFQYKPIST